MRHRSWPLPARLAVIAVFAAFAWGFFAPSSVRAGCGDYVTMDPQHAAPTPHARPAPASVPTIDSLRTSVPAAEPFAPPSCACRPPVPSQEQAPPPCPSCSVPVAPGTAAAPAPARDSPDGAITATGVLTAATPPLDPVSDRGEPVLARQPSAIFRPPRFR